MLILGEIIGLATMFARLLKTVKFFNEAIQDLPKEIERLLRQK